MKKEVKCKHYNGEGYGYDISDKETLLLCDQCHLNLAGRLMGQLAIEVFLDSMERRKENEHL